MADTCPALCLRVSEFIAFLILCFWWICFQSRVGKESPNYAQGLESWGLCLPDTDFHIILHFQSSGSPWPSVTYGVYDSWAIPSSMEKIIFLLVSVFSYETSNEMRRGKNRISKRRNNYDVSVEWQITKKELRTQKCPCIPQSQDVDIYEEEVATTETEGGEKICQKGQNNNNNNKIQSQENYWKSTTGRLACLLAGFCTQEPRREALSSYYTLTVSF